MAIKSLSIDYLAVISASSQQMLNKVVILAKAFARDYVITGIHLSVCLFVYLFVCYHYN